MREAAIQDYAIIGDCRSAALVSRTGSIDWLCWPRFDSPTLFAALVDSSAGGHFRITPRRLLRVTRRYVGETAVLETRFETADGVAVLTDFMPVESEPEKRALFTADHEILRQIRCEEGTVTVDIELRPRPGYGTRPVRLRDAGPLGIRTETGEGTLLLRGEVPLALVDRSEARGVVTLAAGESKAFSLSYSEEAPAVLHPLGKETSPTIDRAIAWWSGWSSRLRYEGMSRDSVVRSAITLKLMTFAPSGAIVAAPTTSLPERIGGALNWDYRYCWLRDASFTARALLGLGYLEEADAWVNWLLYSTRLRRPGLCVLYDVYGEQPPKERELAHLHGYRGSRPVRIGNGARDQLQLDIYGEVIDATVHLIRAGARLDRATCAMLCRFGDYVCDNWEQPDEGIWEVRSGRYPHTHSRLLCWVALDRLIELHEKAHIRIPIERFTAERGRIRREIEMHGWNQALSSYVSSSGGAELDATALLLPWYGFCDASDDRMRRTYRAIRSHLDAGRGLLYRYRNTESPGEGAFALCGFWAVEHLARGGGTRQEAEAAFSQMLEHGNDLGLYGEEVDPATGDALGNFPQAYTHVGLINAALSLECCAQGREVSQPPVPHAAEAPRQVAL